ncbi:MAG TPA: hypothetical protein VGE41_08575 [Verrucomicrobiae bacterium]
MDNQIATVVIVPSVGRVMQFRFHGGNDVFWENPSLAGKSQDPAATEWSNFGGDKAWPSPEGEWGRYTGNNKWKPPSGFDGQPATASREGNEVVLYSAVDAFYGIQVMRRVHLEEKQPRMTITTTFKRVKGAPAKLGIWTVTQLRHPEGIFVAIPKNSRMANGFVPLMVPAPPSIKLEGQILSLARDQQAAFKIGTEASTLLWVGTTEMLGIESRRVSGRQYPDQGSSAEVYTSPNPLEYIELEMLGPLETLKTGEQITRVNTYTLYRRVLSNPDVEARVILSKSQ